MSGLNKTAQVESSWQQLAVFRKKDGVAMGMEKLQL